MENPSVFDVFTNYFSGGAQRAPKVDFGGLLGTLRGLFGGPFRHFGEALALLGHRLGTKCSQNRHDEGLKSDLGLSRGGQAVSESLNASILKRFSSLFVLRFGTFACCFCKKGFVHHGCSVALQLLFAMC